LLHVLGGGPWQLPTIRLAQSIGIRVLVTDVYKERPAYALAEFHEVVDITDKEGTLDVARRYQVDGVLCDTTDVGVPTAAYVAEKLGLPGIGYETALNFADKGRMRIRSVAAGLPAPEFRLARSAGDVSAAARDIGLPVVVKPVDNQSGRGVTRVGTLAELEAAAGIALGYSPSRCVLVEECLSGCEVIVDSFSVAGCVHLLGVAHKTPYPDNPTISSRIAYPARLSESMIVRLRVVNEKLIRALGLVSGVTHAEYMIVGDDAVPLDIAARGGGVNIYTHAAPHVSGVDVNRAMIEFALGQPFAIAPRGVPRAASIDFMRAPAGTLAEITGADSAAASTGVAVLHFNAKVGDVVGSLASKDDRLGFVVALGDTLHEAVARAEAATSRIKVRVCGHDAPEPVA